jgi:hypothetical protein
MSLQADVITRDGEEAYCAGHAWVIDEDVERIARIDIEPDWYRIHAPADTDACANV